MRYPSPSTTIFFVLFAVAGILLAVSHVIESTVECPVDNPTSREWREHRQQAEQLETKMRQCKDSVELESLRCQHLQLIEQWKKRIKPAIGHRAGGTEAQSSSTCPNWKKRCA
jgi:hypothetical protein